MKTIHKLILSTAMLMILAFTPHQTSAQQRGEGIPDLTEQQRTEMRKLKDEHFMERNRMADRVKNDRREMHKKYDQKLRSILTEKQYYAFKQKAKNKGRAKGKGRKGGRQGRGFHQRHRSF